MLRLIHSQTVTGPIRVDDIDDGLPNKEVHRLGSKGDPKAYERDGYANHAKQPCYVPRVKKTDATIAGYIDLRQTRRVLASAGLGKISKFQTSGMISVVSFLSTDLTAPNMSAATRGSPSTGDATMVGTNFLSVAPELSTVRVFGAGVGNITLTPAQILAVGGGVFTNTSIVIKASLVPGLAAGDSIQVRANAQLSNIRVF
jgi:hypothetical protein